MNKFFYCATVVIVGFLIALTLFFIICHVQSYFTNPSNLDMSCLKFDNRRTCHFMNKDAYRYYGTKTSYRTVIADTDNNNFTIGDCRPHIFYLFSRHATRYPDRYNINQMLQHLPILRGKIFAAFAAGESKICPEDIKRLESWKQNFKPDDDNKITESGEHEAADLARRYKIRFPSLLSIPYSLQNFTFEYTSRERTFQTAQAFAYGLFSTKGPGYVAQDGKVNDDVLQFHTECSGYLKKCNASTEHLEELKKFEKGPFRKLLIRDISSRVGFDLSYDEIETMYRACTFSYAMEIDDSWCAIFSEQDLKIMEYESDLDDYYKDSYGNELNYKQACPVVKFVLNLFRNQRESKAVLHFSHAGAVKKIYSMLNLFRDAKHLKWEELCHQNGRQWRSSLIAPFNSNLALVLLSCDNEKKIAAFLNEKPVVLGGCNDFFCSIEDFYKSYSTIAQNCDIKSKCCSCCTE